MRDALKDFEEASAVRHHDDSGVFQSDIIGSGVESQGRVGEWSMVLKELREEQSMLMGLADIFLRGSPCRTIRIASTPTRR